MYGIWCGKDAAVGVVEDFSVAFLRIREDVIASVLRHRSYGTVSVVYGLGKNREARAVYCARHPESGESFCNEALGEEYLEKHSEDSFDVGPDGNMTYRMYDGTDFQLAPAEEICMEEFNKKNPVDPDLSVADRMAQWNICQNFEYGEGYFEVSLTTFKYCVYYGLSVKDKYVYCRVGQNGYSEKGWAMLSTVCIRQNECRMMEDHLQALQEYRPMEECFVKDGCAFPSDGGWYWSLKEVTDDVIYLNGCGGETYEIFRRK